MSYQYYPQAPPPNNDQEHLRLLSIGYYVVAGLTALFGMIPIVHVVMGVMMVTGRFPMSGSSGGGAPPDFMGWFFIVIGVSIITIAMIMALLNFLVARFIARRERRTFCIVIAALNCLNAPLGTLIGVFTIIVLSRDSVRPLFQS